jgi:hypothetical protein
VLGATYPEAPSTPASVPADATEEGAPLAGRVIPSDQQIKRMLVDELQHAVQVRRRHKEHEGGGGAHSPNAHRVGVCVWGGVVDGR